MGPSTTHSSGGCWCPQLLAPGCCNPPAADPTAPGRELPPGGTVPRSALASGLEMGEVVGEEGPQPSGQAQCPSQNAWSPIGPESWAPPAGARSAPHPDIPPCVEDPWGL